MQPNTNILGGFVDKKKAESSFLSLEDGESVQIARLRDIKMVTKAGYGGEEKEVLRFKCEVMTVEGLRDKDFDNGTQRFAQEMQEKGVTIGSSFVLTRTGTQTKTRYTVSQVVNPGSGMSAPQAGAAQMPVGNPAIAPAPAPVVEVAPIAEPVSTTAPVAP